MGMGLVEKLSIDGQTVITEIVSVNAESPANRLGVQVGCIVVEVNGAPYISHSHLIATLRHGKRPVTIKLKYPK